VCDWQYSWPRVRGEHVTVTVGKQRFVACPEVLVDLDAAAVICKEPL
jgi:hypothetical protein